MCAVLLLYREGGFKFGLFPLSANPKPIRVLVFFPSLRIPSQSGSEEVLNECSLYECSYTNRWPVTARPVSIRSSSLHAQSGSASRALLAQWSAAARPSLLGPPQSPGPSLLAAPPPPGGRLLLLGPPQPADPSLLAAPPPPAGRPLARLAQADQSSRWQGTALPPHG